MWYRKKGHKADDCWKDEKNAHKRPKWYLKTEASATCIEMMLSSVDVTDVITASKENATNKYSSGIGVSVRQENAANKYSSGIGVWAQQENAADKYSSGIGVWAHQEDKAKKYSSGIGVLAEVNECRIEKRQNVKSVEKFEQRGVSECGIDALHFSGSGESCEGFTYEL